MKVYVAGASSDIERAEAVMAKLREHGIEVTSTWPEVIRKVGGANPPQMVQLERKKVSVQDLLEVEQAHVLLVLQPSLGKTTIGAYVEMGFAFSRTKWILWSCGGEPCYSTIFTGITDVVQTDNAAIARIVAARAP